MNPAYKQDEFEFYIADLGATAVIIPRGAHEKGSPAVRAAQKYEAAIVECYWSEDRMIFDVKEKGKLDSNEAVHLNEPHVDDVALVLHTSGTTGKPKAVPLTHKNLDERQYLPNLLSAIRRPHDASNASFPRARLGRIFLITTPRWQCNHHPVSLDTGILDRFCTVRSHLVHSNSNPA